MSATDRRHEPRVHAVDLVSVEEFDHSGFQKELSLGKTLDLSHDGMRLEMTHCIPLRSKVKLKLQLGEQILDVTGWVRSVCALDNTTCDMGIRFEDVDPETYEKLEEYLQLRSE
jgi:c-di-GMP-binding flagellar brake protein YcgR